MNCHVPVMKPFTNTTTSKKHSCLDVEFYSLAQAGSFARRERILDRVLSYLNDLTHGHFIEMGCGAGFNLRYLRRILPKDVHLIGLDHSLRTLQLASQITGPGVSLVAACIRRPILRFNSVNAALYSFVLHHLDDIVATFSKMGAYLSAGATVSVVTLSHDQIRAFWLAPWFPEAVTLNLKRYPTIEDICRALELAGLVVIATDRIDLPLILREEEVRNFVLLGGSSALRSIDTLERRQRMSQLMVESSCWKGRTIYTSYFLITARKEVR